MSTTTATSRLTKAQAAVFLAPIVGVECVSESTLDRWRRFKAMPYLRLGGRITFDPSELRQWVESQKRNKQPAPL